MGQTGYLDGLTKISIRTFNHGMSILLPISVGELNSKFVLDTGACVSIISTGLYYRIPPDSRPELRPVDRSLKLEVADDSLLSVEGITSLEFKVNKDIFSWDVFVSPIREDGLIGLDFLQFHDYVLGAKTGLRLNNRKYTTVIEKVPFRAVRVMCREDTVVPANSEFILEGEGNCMLLSSKYALISPSSEIDIDGIIIGNSLVRSTKNGANLPVRVANLTCEDLNIEKGTTLGFMQSVDDSDILNENSVRVLSGENVRVNQVSTKGDVDIFSWSGPLRELYNRSCGNLSETQRFELKNLLNKYRNVFSTSPTDLGKTNVVHHSIPTGNARPVKLPPRRTPRAFADEEDKIIKEQVDAGIIRESSSPWSAALVYVKKKDGSTRPCVDYRRLNAVTAKDAYPLPRIDDCLDSLEGAVYFNSMDLTSGFYQIPVKKATSRKLHFQPVRMGFMNMS